MDLSTKGPLTEKEIFEISRDIHVVVLEEAFRAGGWKEGEAILHGGSSLRLGYGSSRGSEDLDFIVSDEVDRIDKIMSAVHRRLDTHFAAKMQGALISLKPPSDLGDRLSKWDIKWTHPNRRGKVLVKAEFWKTPRDVMAEYSSKTVRMVDTDKGIRITTPVTIAEMQSIWGDKVVAIGGRPSLKWRDAYDLAFVAQGLRGSNRYPDEQEAVALVAASAALYDRDLEVILEASRNLLSSGQLEDGETFTKDILRWLPPQSDERHAGVDYFTSMLGRAKAELEWAVNSIEAHLSRGITP